VQRKLQKWDDETLEEGKPLGLQREPQRADTAFCLHHNRAPDESVLEENIHLVYKETILERSEHSAQSGCCAIEGKIISRVGHISAKKTFSQLLPL
jgi:hypothetical protein